MDISEAVVLYTPREDERVGGSIVVGPSEFGGPTITFGSYNLQRGVLVKLILNAEGTRAESNEFKDVPLAPRFLAFTKSQKLVVAGDYSIALVDPTGKSRLSYLLKLSGGHGYKISGGYVLSEDRVIVGTESNGLASDNLGPVFIFDLNKLSAENFPLSCKIYGGSFCHNGKFFNVDVPTQEVRIFDLSDWQKPFTTLINFKEHWTGNSFPTGLTGPYSFEGKHYCLVTLSDRSVGIGRVVVVCIETCQLVHEILLPGAGQVTSAIVSNGYLYMTTSARDYNEFQLTRNPKAGSVYSCTAPKFLSNPPEVPLLKIE